MCHKLDSRTMRSCRRVQLCTRGKACECVRGTCRHAYTGTRNPMRTQHVQFCTHLSTMHRYVYGACTQGHVHRLGQIRVSKHHTVTYINHSLGTLHILTRTHLLRCAHLLTYIHPRHARARTHAERRTRAAVLVATHSQPRSASLSLGQ